MRIVAGSGRGRRLQAPPGRGTRPTSDRVREALFSMLTSLGGLEGVAVADLFAGSGALGVEALSRGAARALFVDHERGAVTAIRANLGVLGLADAATTVRQGDVGSALAEAAATDVVFADPPYAFDGWEQLLEGLAACGFGGLAVLESDREVAVPAGWDVVRARRYGGTVVTLARVEPASGPPARPSHDADRAGSEIDTDAGQERR